MSEKFIYSTHDVRLAIRDALEHFFGHDLIEIIGDKIIDKLERYSNWYRFQGRNCTGCVSSPYDCDVAYGRGKGKGIWDKAFKGDVFDCPSRLNGTLLVNNSKESFSVQSLDVSSRKEPPYPIIEVKP